MWIDDQVFNDCDNKLSSKVFVPNKSLVVVGNGNDALLECHKDRIEKDEIDLLRRRGGGGAVVLYPGCVVVSVGAWVKDFYNNGHYFDKINDAVIQSLSLGFKSLKDLELKGISDIAYKNRKVSGTSMFRSRNYLLYQASILVTLNLDIIEKYLCHPSKEPDYRVGKPHKDFLTSLSSIDSEINCDRIEELLKNCLHSHLELALKEDLIQPVESQKNYIKQKTLADYG